MSRKPFPSHIIQQAKTIALPTSINHRPQVTGITIDGAASKDLDDAIWIQSQRDLTTLWVHIADVAELVTPDTDLDREAIARVQTLYYRDRSDPMLPRCLSENKLSLLEQQPRPTLTLEITLDQAAEVQQVSVYESWLSSQKRFSYPQAEAALKDSDLPYSSLIRECWQWAERLYQKRTHLDNFDGLPLPQGYYLDENGNLLSTDYSRFHGYLIIQEFMILANTAIAGWLAENNIPAIFRNHTHRDIGPEQTHQFEALVNAQSEEDIRRVLMGWLNPADYGPYAQGHFALNLAAYCHFTSPIRRLPDLINHRMIKAHLNDQPLPYTHPEIDQLSRHINTVIQKQDEATNTFFKNQQHQLYYGQLQAPEQFEQLSEREFSLLLKYATQEKQAQILDAEAAYRLQAGKLQVEDLFVLLLLGDNRALQQQVLHYLKEHLYDAPSIMSIAVNQLEDWQSFQYIEHEGCPPFSAWLEVQINQQLLTTAQPAISRSKPGARHRACLNWLIASLEDTLVAPEQREVPPVHQPLPSKQLACLTKLKQFKEGQNCLSLLLELCQGFQWSQPDYQITEQEDGFICECRLVIENNIIMGRGIASSKKTAKHRAARQVVNQLQDSLLRGESLIALC